MGGLTIMSLPLKVNLDGVSSSDHLNAHCKRLVCNRYDLDIGDQIDIFNTLGTIRTPYK